MIDRVDRFYEIASNNQDLMRDIFIAVPVRPHDGLAVDLSNKLSAWFQVNIPYAPLETGMNGFIEVTRMRIAWDFLHNRSEKFLLMIDNDTEPPIDLPWLLARHDEAVVGSCVVSLGPHGRRMLCFTRHDDTGAARMVDFEDGDKIPAVGLAPVPHCGTGAMMIRRDVLQSFSYMPEGKCDSCGHSEWDIPFMIPDYIKVRGMRFGRLGEGEDIRFCKQARAKGFGVFVDMEAHCGHRKAMRMGFPQHLRDPSLKVEDWVASRHGLEIKET